MDFDEKKVHYSHQNLYGEGYDAIDESYLGNLDDLDVDVVNDEKSRLVRRYLKNFFRNYRHGPHRYLYRERLLCMYRRTFGDELENENDVGDGGGSSSFQGDAGGDVYPAIEVDLAHLGEFDANLMSLLLARPSFTMPLFEAAAADALRSFFYDVRRDGPRGTTPDDDDDDNNNGEEPTTTTTTATHQSDDTEKDRPSSYFGSIQVLLKGNLSPTPLRSISASHIGQLLLVPGIVIQAARGQSRASRLRIRCGRCAHSMPLKNPAGHFGPLSTVPLPSRCHGPQPDECGFKPYAVVPDECTFVDQQTIKLQETPGSVPTGEMPRSVLLVCERSLVDRATPGSRVMVLGVASVLQAKTCKSVYLQVLGMQGQRQKNYGTGENGASLFSKAEEEAFRALSRRSDIYDILHGSIAPSITGSTNIKKALACLLFGGSQKKLPDHARLRGDINVLLIGDPSTAKSQMLKFVEQVAPIGVYTSGKGSSAAGLTASVVKDAARGEFCLEAGAMVLADGGVVCIDEFDKMRPADRVAIHEAMEQQTISVAKAGINTVLNARTSVLAAANPIYGRYDDLKTIGENIDLMTTILSRFDLIFLVRDIRDEERDKAIAKHVLGIHMNSQPESLFTNNTMAIPGVGMNEGYEDGNDMNFAGSNSNPESVAENAMRVAHNGGELDIPTLKKYIQYCRSKCFPRLSEEAGESLVSNYVRIRDGVRRKNDDHQKGAPAIPITVRQLEALIRLSESLARMRLQEQVQSRDIQEALRLFRVSTMATNGGGDANVNPHFPANGDDTYRAETYLRSVLMVGATVNKKRVVDEAISHGYHGHSILRAIHVMCSRGELMERNQSRLLKRIM